MAVKAINDTADSHSLFPTFLIFRAYPCMTEYDSPTPTMSQRAAAIKIAMKEVQRIWAKRQMADAFNQRNRPAPILSVVHNLLLNSNVLVWREGNAGHSGEWTGLFKLLDIDKEVCKMQLPTGPPNFRITTVKPYLKEDPDT